MQERTLRDASRFELWARSARIAVDATHRLSQWAIRPHQFAAPCYGRLEGARVVYQTRVSLLSKPVQHEVFEAGKRHNLRLAAPRFDDLVLNADRPFSFWRTLGPATAARGYVHGMELASGCVVPAIGGGLCLLARALFQAAVLCGFDIVERHGHSLAVVDPPAGAPRGLDATILYPHIDLRFRARTPTHLRVRVRDDALLVEVRQLHPEALTYQLETIVHEEPPGERPRRRTLVVRHAFDAAKHPVRSDLIAMSDTRVVAPDRRQRNCLTCNEARCQARVTLP